jgi:hypothetical protein
MSYADDLKYTALRLVERVRAEVGIENQMKLWDEAETASVGVELAQSGVHPAHLAQYLAYTLNGIMDDETLDRMLAVAAAEQAVGFPDRYDQHPGDHQADS